MYGIFFLLYLLSLGCLNLDFASFLRNLTHKAENCNVLGSEYNW